METKLLRKESHFKWIERLLLDRQKVYGVVSHGKRISYQRIVSPNELAKDFIIPHLSAKSFVFPSIENLFVFSKKKNNISIEDLNLDTIPRKIIVGVRPCDAVGIKNLGAIFKWSPEDSIFRKRAESITIVSYACNQADDYCFCTSMGGSPGVTQGSDVLLTQTESGDYIVEIITNKGGSAIAVASDLFEEIDPNLQKEKYLANVPIYFDDTHFLEKINKAFNTPIFDEYAMRCIGCNICAFVCPVCACFDIQDENKGNKGRRLRCWDSCGSESFTFHASGHNPRYTQGMRWRQRLMHKFSYMPERIQIKGCVGCGRCSRYCPVDMNMSEQLANIANCFTFDTSKTHLTD